MKQLLAVQGSRRQRMFIYGLTIILGCLFYWALGYLVQDVSQLPAPSLDEISKKYVSKTLTEQVKTHHTQLQALNTQLNMLSSQRDRLKQSTESVKLTIQQIGEQEKIRTRSLTAEEQKTKQNSMALFLENQRKDQELTQMIIKLTQQQQEVQNQINTINTQLTHQQEPADKEYKAASKTYQLTVASIQIAFLTVILIISAFLIRKYQKSKLKPIFLALFIAAFVQVSEVIHACFPTAYFKYILIAALIAITIQLLMKAISNAESKQLEVLLKRYRDAYLYFVCPICEFPIRRGPLKYLYWTRRSIANVTSTGVDDHEKDQPYTCPVCSTTLFAACEECKGIRHALLPSCEHCGNTLSIQA